MNSSKFSLIANNSVLGLAQCYLEWLKQYNLKAYVDDYQFMYHDFIHVVCGLDTSPIGEVLADAIEFCSTLSEEEVLTPDFLNRLYYQETQQYLNQEQYNFLWFRIKVLNRKFKKIPDYFVETFIVQVKNHI